MKTYIITLGLLELLWTICLFLFVILCVYIENNEKYFYHFKRLLKDKDLLEAYFSIGFVFFIFSFPLTFFIFILQLFEKLLK